MKNTENSELDMNQLDTISGGLLGDVIDDSVLLHKLGIMDEEFGIADVTFSWKSCSAKVDAAWAKIGITCCSRPGSENSYFYQGRSITGDEAKKIAKDLMIKGPKINVPLSGQ
jgi:hypothetical protein